MRDMMAEDIRTGSYDRMILHDLKFFISQFARLVQDLIINANLADIM